MAIKQTAHIIRGLRRDFSDSKQPKEYAIDAKNIRITNREDSSLLSITNEKGTQEITFNNNISGNYLGHTTINDILVLFTRDTNTDYIYKINLSNNTNITLFEGKLSDETIDHIEALGVYESEDIQKVYWVDGVSQPRMINIKNETKRTDVKEFDFIQELKLNEIIKVEKSYNSGSFNSGVIQYAFNYYNKNGQESNIVEVTPINYISYEDRGAAPNDYVSNSFKITISNYDKNFDYLRLYSIHRTSLDAIPSVKIVADINLKIAIAENKVTVTYLDTGIIGETIDPAELLYKGGEYIIPKTLAQKDGTLFFGNIKLNNKNIYNSDFESTIKNWRNLEEDDEKNPVLVWGNRVFIKDINLQGYYPFKSYLNNNSEAAGFKSRETYRLGIQFQHKTGRWSDPIWYKDSEVTSTPSSEQSNGLISYKKTIASLHISEELKTWAVNNGYLRVRPVVVYPQESEREVVAQGILCPTVFNASSRHNKVLEAQSSWFFRPHVDNIDDDDNTFNLTSIYGSYSEYRHGYALPLNAKRNAEIQNTIYASIDEDGNSIPLYLDRNITYQNTDLFGIDSSIVTFHSPELEFKKVFNLEGTKLRIVGFISFDASAMDIDVTTSTAAALVDSLPNFQNNYVGISLPYQYGGGTHLNLATVWRDSVVMNDGEDVVLNSERAWAVYPWHKEGSLNNDARNLYGKLKTKKISNLLYSISPTFIESREVSVCDIELFDSDPLRLKVPNALKNKDYFRYSGNIDSILKPAVFDINIENINVTINKYPFVITKANDENSPSFSEDWDRELATVESIYKTHEYVIKTSNDKISMKYKSSPHAVISLGDLNLPNNLYILPKLNKSKDADSNSIYSLNIKDILEREYSIIQSIYNINYSVPTNYLWLAELYREEVPNKFGGDNYENNIWYPAGKSERIAGIPDNGVYHPKSGNIRVEFTQGDTFFARFDSLKTYSDDLDAVNSVTEIGSFMVETRINLDARYDRNRGQQSNLVMNPGNFNLFNDVYNQKNNFFNYRIIDKDIVDNTEFPNTIVWSKQKFAGADVDAWTNINMASSLDLDGTKGELTKLVSFKNEIFSFQPEAINHILFNSRVQIPTSDGVPIELTNAYKVDGARQLSSVGSSNPLAIKSTDRGIYYMDNITKGIYVFNGQQSESLSDKLGMSSWVKEQNIDSYKVNYDKINQDVYFNGDECLCYSEKLGEFESFFDYTASIIFNAKDSTYAVNSTTLYKLFEGDYNNFFDEEKPFWITFTHNENPFNDKIYNTLEFRADTYEYNTKEDEDGDIITYCELSNNSSFDTIKVKNEYQDTEEVSLEFAKYIPSNLKRKFRIWRANIPRDFVNKRDRIRNTWANITLKASNPSNTKTELHDLVVSYFM